ncbi:MAG TPA: hypothetical protein VF092_12510 [Longimicrobium sp.]
MTGKRLAAVLGVVAMLGAACSKQGGGDYQGGSEGATGDTTGMNGGANSGSNSDQASPQPAATPSTVPPVQAPPASETGPNTISSPSGSGTPAHMGGTRDTTGKRP